MPTGQRPRKAHISISFYVPLFPLTIPGPNFSTTENLTYQSLPDRNQLVNLTPFLLFFIYINYYGFHKSNLFFFRLGTRVISRESSQPVRFYQIDPTVLMSAIIPPFVFFYMVLCRVNTCSHAGLRGWREINTKKSRGHTFIERKPL